MDSRKDCHWTNKSSWRDAEQDDLAHEEGGHGHDSRTGRPPPGRPGGRAGTRTAISLHIYGTDITRTGSSARRYYS